MDLNYQENNAAFLNFFNFHRAPFIERTISEKFLCRRNNQSVYMLDGNGKELNDRNDSEYFFTSFERVR